MSNTPMGDYREGVEEHLHSLIRESGLSVTDIWGLGALNERIHEAADSACNSEWDVIVASSPNEDAIFAHRGGGALQDCGSMQDVKTRVAYYAYSQDLHDALGRMGDSDVGEVLGHDCCEDCGDFYDPEDHPTEAKALLALAHKEQCPECLESGEDEDD